MADNARDQDFNLEAEAAGVDRSDPLMELAQLMSGDAPEATKPEPPVMAAPTPPVVPAAPPANDLEAQLLAELGMGSPAAPVEEPVIAQSDAESVVVEPAPMVEPIADLPPPVEPEPAVAPPSIEDELAALLDADPSAPVSQPTPQADAVPAEPVVEPVVADEPSFNPAPAPELQEGGRSDDRGAAQTVSPYDFSDDARTDSRGQTSEPEEIVDAFDTDLDDYMAVDFDAMDEEPEAEAVEELQAAPPPFSVDADVSDDVIPDAVEEGEIEPPMVEETVPEAEAAPTFDADEAAPDFGTPDEVDVSAETADVELDDQFFDGFDDELNGEFDALFDDDMGELDAGNDEPPAAQVPDTPEPALEASPEPETPSIADYAAPAAAVAAGAAAMGAARDSGDDLLDHIGLGTEPSASPLDELDAIMSEPTPQKPARPDIQTTDLDALTDEVFADFEVPDMPQEANVPPAPVAAGAGQGLDDLDFDLDIESELNSVELTPDSAPAGADFDEDFASDDFEAVMARDMEYASHARAAPVVDDNDLFGDIDLEEPVEEPAAAQPKKRGFFVAGITIAVALIGAVGVFALTGGSNDTATGPITVEADPTPIKVEPEEPGGSDVPNQDRALFNAENETAVANQPALVTTSEEPVDIANAPGAALPSAVANKDDERLLPSAAEAESGSEPVTSVNARRVRTLVVRPDGTLVEQPAEAPAAETPAVAVPEIVAQAPAAAAQAVEDAAQAASEAATQAVTENTGVAFNPPAAAPAPRAAPATPAGSTQVPVRTVETQTITPPIIADRPNQQPVNIVNPQPQQNTQVAAAPRPAAPAPAPAAPAPSAASSPFAVQIASVPSRDGAQQSAINLQQRFSNILSGRGISIQEAQIEGRGTFYRVRVGAQSRDDANALCAQYKRAGGSCFVTR